jgi:restriction system protein
LLFEFVNDPRKFEEFIAAAYRADGWDKVILTPRSGDLGRDVIASRQDPTPIRLLDQCKAFSPGYVVEANDVRALFGVVSKDLNASKGVVTTTSTFAPGIEKEFKDEYPYRLDLRDGEKLMEWLRSIAGEK